MQTTGSISLLPHDILSLKGVKGSIEKKSFGRFRTLLESACAPLHIPDPKAGREPIVVITESNVRPLHLPAPGSGQETFLRVLSAGRMGLDLSLLVRKDYRPRFSPAETFSEVARAGAFDLEIGTCTYDPERKIAYLALSEKLDFSSLSLMTSDTLPLLNSGRVWAALAAQGKSPRYAGLMVDTKETPGRMTIAGFVESHVTPQGCVAFPWAPEDVSALIRDHREEIEPRLLTALVIEGYRNWGGEFLKKAER